MKFWAKCRSTRFFATLSHSSFFPINPWCSSIHLGFWLGRLLGLQPWLHQLQWPMKSGKNWEPLAQGVDTLLRFAWIVRLQGKNPTMSSLMDVILKLSSRGEKERPTSTHSGLGNFGTSGEAKPSEMKNQTLFWQRETPFGMTSKGGVGLKQFRIKTLFEVLTFSQSSGINTHFA